MSESQVDRVQTPLSMQEWASAAHSAWVQLMGSNPARQQLAVLWGQYMVETGGAACWNYNVGNIKHVDGDGFNWIDLPGTWETVNGQKVILPEGHPGRRFRAFSSLNDGMLSYLQTLKRRFSKAWPYVLKGDPEGFSYALKDQGYYTGDADAYARLARSNFDDFMRKVTTIQVAPKPFPWLPVLAAVAVVGGGAYVAHKKGYLHLPHIPLPHRLFA